MVEPDHHRGNLHCRLYAKPEQCSFVNRAHVHSTCCDRQCQTVQHAAVVLASTCQSRMPERYLCVLQVRCLTGCHLARPSRSVALQ